jgi:serine/threonine-protein kinase RsbW
MAGWRMRELPDVDEHIARWTLDRPPQLSELRTRLQEAVLARARAADDAADLAADLAERLTIVATELAGNALRHAGTPAVVTLLRADGHLIIDVIDDDRGSRPVAGRRRPPGDGGLGLTLTERLAEDVGWYPTKTGKHVWAIFRLPGDLAEWR